MVHVFQIAHGIDERGVIADAAADVQGHHPQYLEAIATKGLANGCFGRRLDHISADPASKQDAGQGNESSKQKWNAPSPLLQLLWAQDVCKQIADAGTQKHPCHRSPQPPDGKEAAFAIRCLFRQENDRTGVLASHGDTLNEAEQHDDDRRCDADLTVGGQQSHQHGGDGHGQHRQLKCLAPSEKIADASEQHPSKGTHQKACGKGTEGSNQ